MYVSGRVHALDLGRGGETGDDYSNLGVLLRGKFFGLYVSCCAGGTAAPLVVLEWFSEPIYISMYQYLWYLGTIIVRGILDDLTLSELQILQGMDEA